jgi:hypothetical protein
MMNKGAYVAHINDPFGLAKHKIRHMQTGGVALRSRQSPQSHQNMKWRDRHTAVG